MVDRAKDLHDPLGFLVHQHDLVMNDTIFLTRRRGSETAGGRTLERTTITDAVAHTQRLAPIGGVLGSRVTGRRLGRAGLVLAAVDLGWRRRCFALVALGLARSILGWRRRAVAVVLPAFRSRAIGAVIGHSCLAGGQGRRRDRGQHEKATHCISHLFYCLNRRGRAGNDTGAGEFSGLQRVAEIPVCALRQAGDRNR
ncbi:hypothetical protein PYTT13_21035 (plasmid) [Paracoccus yeei]|uniref:Uncharacterized protein n=1 Tax=Paracoccus yeei TaxID=147645 RepID=A0A2D2C760_9RHOB|nr:hypothetical protein PYTT13_21035 [Paracoccus yeei]